MIIMLVSALVHSLPATAIYLFCESSTTGGRLVPTPNSISLFSVPLVPPHLPTVQCYEGKKQMNCMFGALERIQKQAV